MLYVRSIRSVSSGLENCLKIVNYGLFVRDLLSLLGDVDLLSSLTSLYIALLCFALLGGDGDDYMCTLMLVVAGANHSMLWRCIPSCPDLDSLPRLWLICPESPITFAGGGTSCTVPTVLSTPCTTVRRIAPVVRYLSTC